MSYNKYRVVFDSGLLISATFKKQDIFYNVTCSIIPTTDIQFVANISTLKLNGAHLLLQGIDDPGIQATHTNTIATNCVFSFNYCYRYCTFILSAVFLFNYTW
jgi:hypothetical protein